MDILDQILAAEMANEYADSQRIAYTTKTPCNVSWFGDTTGLAVLPGEMIDAGLDFYQVSKDIIVSYDNLSLVYKAPGGMTSVKEVYAVEDGASAILFYCTSSLGDDAIHAIALREDISEEITAGLYYAKKEELNVAAVFGLYAETVHQIDRKFIPESPIFTPTTEIPYGGEPAMLTKEESDELVKLAKKYDVIRVAYKGQTITATRFYDSGIESGKSEAWYYSGMYLGSTGAYPSMKIIMLVCDPSGELCMAMDAPLATYIMFDIPGISPITET